jgi:hypothetical protein
MAINGTFPIAQLPLLPIRQAPTTQVQKSGTPSVADRTITTPQDFLSLTFTPGGQVVQVNPSMMGPEDLLEVLSGAGLTGSVSLDRYGFLHFPSITSISGNANLKTALGLP